MQAIAASSTFSPLLLDHRATIEALPFDTLCDEIRTSVIELRDNKIDCPERQILAYGTNGQMSSLPCTSHDLGVHKLVTYLPDNPASGLPSIHGLVTAWDVVTGRPVAQLDGIAVTARRTAALSMVAMQLLSRTQSPLVAIIGTGAQAAGHLQALEALYPTATVQIKGLTAELSEAFCQQHRGSPLSVRPLYSSGFDEIDVVITTTTARSPIYHEQPMKDRLLIGVGAFLPEMAEYAPGVVNGSQLFIDEPNGGRREAGDYLQAEVDWSKICTLADAIEGHIDFQRPRMFKCVGGSAFDLAAVRCALRHYDRYPKSP
ncbi:delta(1)-pyrroline-2-carboxylate reductase family protein [Pseudomonas sp. DCB_AW]|uniref:delta(1)-pyrroline-2-carboxylate reductase family protein n=1 Tax=Pseudomonas sp. DCB_AW TaxID=2993596 RepID=UPI002248F023|nr:delta(1)-pyrroline-2-carboxylate reductase family protein [Pseudomonas sp. DCB_AW]MCX2684673.1 delta(1)-pyrroline-2-carboxylate reductase family protein [Pseudomonas sp. DCB_AW]